MALKQSSKDLTSNIYYTHQAKILSLHQNLCIKDHVRTHMLRDLTLKDPMMTGASSEGVCMGGPFIKERGRKEKKGEEDRVKSQTSWKNVILYI